MFFFVLHVVLVPMPVVPGININITAALRWCDVTISIARWLDILGGYTHTSHIAHPISYWYISTYLIHSISRPTVHWQRIGHTCTVPSTQYPILRSVQRHEGLYMRTIVLRVCDDPTPGTLYTSYLYAFLHTLSTSPSRVSKKKPLRLA